MGLKSGICCGTGCGFDTAITWTGNLGQPCGTLCGDGLIGWPKERCDDGNVEPFDGCNSTCHPERGRCAEQVATLCVDGWTPRDDVAKFAFCIETQCTVNECCVPGPACEASPSYIMMGTGSICGKEQYRSARATPEECRAWCSGSAECQAYVTFEGSDCGSCLAYTVNDCSAAYLEPAPCSGRGTAYNKVVASSSETCTLGVTRSVSWGIQIGSKLPDMPTYMSSEDTQS